MFFGRTSLKVIEKHEKLSRVRGHAPPEKLKNLHAVLAILVLFE